MIEGLLTSHDHQRCNSETKRENEFQTQSSFNKITADYMLEKSMFNESPQLNINDFGIFDLLSGRVEK